MTSVFAEAPDWLYILAGIPMAFLWFGLLTVIVVQSRKYLCYRHDLTFKRELIERGYEPDEIERLIAAKPPQKE
jgi:hypothetical protein